MSGVRQKTTIAPEIPKLQEQQYHHLAVPISLVPALTLAAYSCSLERSLRSSRPPLHFFAAQVAQTRCSGLIPHRQDVKA
jgi:hypothetical protein